MTWRTLLPHWHLIEQDLHDVYGIDVDDDQLLTARSWRWLNVRIGGLLNRPNATRTRAALTPRTEEARRGA